MTLTKSVLVVVPNTGAVHPLVAKRCGQMLLAGRGKLDVVYPEGSPLDSNMNQATADFLATPYDYMLRLDSDNPPLDLPIRYLDDTLDVLSFLTPCPAEGHTTPNCCVGTPPFASPPEFDGTLEEVDWIGTGCVFLSRKALQRVATRFLGNVWTRPYKKGIAGYPDDWAFAERAKDCGFKLWASSEMTCRHFKTVDISKSPDWQKRLARRDELCNISPSLSPA